MVDTKIEPYEEDKITGIVSKIQRLAIHDGPGIRTIVFLKGCPLECLWCSSPETQSSHPDLLYYPERCLSCGCCVEVCPEKVILISPQGEKTLDRSRCTFCRNCVDVCHAGALQMIGEEKTVSQVLSEVERDRIFYEHSGGGVTISGGEPLHQVEFARALLKACREAALHTAMETSGFQSWELFKTTLPFLDLLLYDLKQMDPVRHKKFTGVSNELILSNLEKALADGVLTIIRFPVVPGFNDDVKNVRAMCDFLHRIRPVVQVDLLPYHRFGEAMYDRLGRTYKLSDVGPKQEEELAHIAQIFIEEGFRVQSGGSG
jgi:pyruvate formate lyase activating enzyme